MNPRKNNDFQIFTRDFFRLNDRSRKGSISQIGQRRKGGPCRRHDVAAAKRCGKNFRRRSNFLPANRVYRFGRRTINQPCGCCRANSKRGIPPQPIRMPRSWLSYALPQHDQLPLQQPFFLFVLLSLRERDVREAISRSEMSTLLHDRRRLRRLQMLQRTELPQLRPDAIDDAHRHQRHHSAENYRRHDAQPTGGYA
jgi:hypothetical protein